MMDSVLVALQESEELIWDHKEILSSKCSTLDEHNDVLFGTKAPPFLTTLEEQGFHLTESGCNKFLLWSQTVEYTMSRNWPLIGSKSFLILRSIIRR